MLDGGNVGLKSSELSYSSTVHYLPIGLALHSGLIAARVSQGKADVQLSLDGYDLMLVGQENMRRECLLPSAPAGFRSW